MAYTFAVDTDKMDDLSQELGNAKQAIETGITDIFSSIDGMEGNSWSGTSYDTFHDGAHNYEEALSTLDEVVEAFQKEIDKMNGLAPDTITEINTQVENMCKD